MIWRIDTIGSDVRKLFGYDDMEQLAKGFPSKVGVTWVAFVQMSQNLRVMPSYCLAFSFDRSCCCQSKWRALVPQCTEALSIFRDALAAPSSATTWPLRASQPAVSSPMPASTASSPTPGEATRTSTWLWMSRGCGPCTPPAKPREPL